MVKYTHDHQVSVISHFIYRQAYLFNSLRYIPYSALSEVQNVIYVTINLFISNPPKVGNIHSPPTSCDPL